jgi:tRNA-2-methylthio-N6-dimethylallyladenosine synthase
MKKLYIETLGCQMNVKDSDHMIAELQQKENFSLTQNPSEADLILINTCSVREKPVAKLFSEIGQFNKIRKENSKLGICGCTASHMGKEIIKKAPSVDFVLGARNVSKITEIIHKPKAVMTDIDFDDTSYVFKDFRSHKHKDFVNIMVGCDKKCTFCIVPKTRGKEISIPSDVIIKQIEKLSKEGVKEITLLGQNVNGYGKRFSNEHKKINFTKLLQEISNIDGIERIRFQSPYPQHADDEFIEEFANNPKICKHIHFPLQSGSTKVLKDMKRGYSKEWFLDRVEKLRKIPNISISTDIIVGFPGETEEDFEETMEVIRKAKFEQIFSFVYSPRPLTEAENFENQVDKEIAKQRLFKLQSVHTEILDEASKNQLGKIYKVLIDEEKDGYLIGKSDNFFSVKIADFEDNLVGKILDVKIIDTHRHSLNGEII